MFVCCVGVCSGCAATDRVRREEFQVKPSLFASLPGLICVLSLTENLLCASGLAVSLSHLLSLCVLHMCSGSLIEPHKNLGRTDLCSVSLLTVFSAFHSPLQVFLHSFKFIFVFLMFSSPYPTHLPPASLPLCPPPSSQPLLLELNRQPKQPSCRRREQAVEPLCPTSLSGEANYCRHTNKL